MRDQFNDDLNNKEQVDTAMLWILAALAVAFAWVAALVGRALFAIWIDEQADIRRRDRIRKRRGECGSAPRDVACLTAPAERPEAPATTGLPIGALTGQG